MLIIFILKLGRALVQINDDYNIHAYIGGRSKGGGRGTKCLHNIQGKVL